MFVHLAILTPTEGRDGDIVESIRRFGEPADRHPALRQHFICRDRKTRRLVGITIWDNEEDWAEPIAEARAAPSDGDGETPLSGPPDVFVLDVIDLVDRIAGREERGGL